MGVRHDFSDIWNTLDNAKSEVGKVLKAIGEDAVEYAKLHGNYTDRTGRLRRSTEFVSDDNFLIVENDTPYASHVEHRGYDVLTGAKYKVQNDYNLKER